MCFGSVRRARGAVRKHYCAFMLHESSAERPPQDRGLREWPGTRDPAMRSPCAKRYISMPDCMGSGQWALSMWPVLPACIWTWEENRLVESNACNAESEIIRSPRFWVKLKSSQVRHCKLIAPTPTLRRGRRSRAKTARPSLYVCESVLLPLVIEADRRALEEEQREERGGNRKRKEVLVWPLVAFGVNEGGGEGRGTQEKEKRLSEEK